jgi:hypothetical protein
VSLCLPSVSNIADLLCAKSVLVPHFPARANNSDFQVWRASIFGSMLCWPSYTPELNKITAGGGSGDRERTTFCKTCTCGHGFSLP